MYVRDQVGLRAEDSLLDERDILGYLSEDSGSDLSNLSEFDKLRKETLEQAVNRFLIPSFRAEIMEELKRGAEVRLSFT